MSALYDKKKCPLCGGIAKVHDREVYAERYTESVHIAEKACPKLC